MVTLSYVEGEEPTFEQTFDPLVRQAAERLQRSLRPRFQVVREVDGRPRITGIVGSVRLDTVTTLEVVPKVPVGVDWVPSVIDLLVGSSRLDLGRDRLAGTSPPRRSLLDLLAAIYAVRLQSALRRDGPLLVLSRKRDRLPVLKGKLEAGRWAREFLTHPTTFPVSFDELTADNDFTRAMAYTARVLGAASSESRVRASLYEAARALRPGVAEALTVPAGVVHRPLPSQWGAYRPAWSVAVAVLSQRALLGRKGSLTGLEVVVEAWPLLETMLRRALDAAALSATVTGRTLASASGDAQLLVPISPDAAPRGVSADGRLIAGPDTVATFEAKYSRRGSVDWPERGHVFQALSTAAAWRSPLAILVYPAPFEPVWWSVAGFGKKPAYLVAVGLDLFRYQSGVGDVTRGSVILDILARASASATGVSSGTGSTIGPSPIWPTTS